VGRKVTTTVGLEGFPEIVRANPGLVREIEIEVDEQDAPPWGVGETLRWVGGEHPRLDGPAKATGAAKYTQDVNRPRMAFAGLLGSPHAHARVTAVDASAAKAMAGVLAVRTFEGTRVVYAGQPVAAVCAESPALLDDALAAVHVTYAVEPAAVTTDDALRDGAPQVEPGRSNDRPPDARREVRRGDVDAAFAQGAVVVEAEYRTAVQTHSCLEPHGCVVEISPEGNATVWASTQATAGFAGGRFARELGVPPNRVRTLTEHMGGGFGSKFGALEWDVLCAAFARETGRPVHLMLPRRLEHLLGGNRPDSIQRLALAGTADGTITGLRGRTWGTSGTGEGQAGAANHSVYRFPALEMSQHEVTTFTAQGRAFRAPRHPQGFFALESLIDLYAAKAGLDPLAVRLANDPHPIRQVQWRLGAERIGWQAARASLPGTGDGPLRRGVGCAAARWGQAGRPPWVVDVALDRRGGVRLMNCSQDIGTGTKTVLAMAAAEELGVAPSAVEVRLGDTNDPAGPGSGGSTTLPSLVPAAREAALRAREALAALLAAEWGVGGAEVVWRGGAFRGPGTRSASFEEACRLIGDEGLRRSGTRRPNWDGPFGETAGCQFAQVAVDVETGVVRVERVVAVHDCGRVINRLTARSQVNGGVIQGISYALHEEKQLDRTVGDMVNPTLDTYRILGMADCPAIDVIFTSVVAGYNNAGVMGLGEPATVPTAAAVANAVFHALGVQVRELPMTPARVLAALAEAGR
jgi:xanthine dehydrogenase YagR molybdenum-binding subunit